MGWLVSMDPTKDRKRLVAELLDDFSRNRYPYPDLLDHSLRGNTLYLLLRNPARRPECVKTGRLGDQEIDLSGLTYNLCGNYRFIAVYLLSGSRNRDEGWGYKSMDESMGPNQVDCPERLLKQSQVVDKWGWREECRAARRKAAKRKQLAKELRPGTELQMFRGYRHDGERPNQPFYATVVFDRPYSRTFFVGHFKGETKQYRMRWSDIHLDEQEAA